MLESVMIGCGVILLLCVSTSKLLNKFGVPILLIFIALGMLFGSDGIVGIYFDNFKLAEEICTVGLAFIMFHGGFSTNWAMAKPIAKPAIIMSTVGVIITSGLTGLFCYFILKLPILEALLIGAIISSTDAASVFTILRTQKLNLKGGLASLLEIESGSNDPFAYMLTLTITVIMAGSNIKTLGFVMIAQIVFGLAIGFGVAKVASIFLKKVELEIDGFYPIALTAVVLLSFSLSEAVGGNGYLSVYVAGLILGNSAIRHKKSLVQFFDGVSWLMQIVLFFILGLLAFPSKLPSVIGVGIPIAIFMLLIARPVAAFLTLKPFKFKNKEIIFISWVGLRGAASMVFAIFALTRGVPVESDLYQIVLLVALVSVLFQGTLIPKVAKMLDLVDNRQSVLKTFNDYKEEKSTELIEKSILEGDRLIGKSIMDAKIPEEILIVMIKRDDEVLVPKGSTVIQKDDILVLSGNNILSVLDENEKKISEELNLA